MPMQAFSPATMSAIAVPVLVGGESGQPDTLINPPIACPMMSYPGLSLYGPYWPKPEIDA